MRRVKVVILCAIALVATPAFAQDNAATDTNMQILLDKVKADKKLVVAANMDLNEAEAKAFWPVYEGYQKELRGLNERLGKTILAYAAAYNKNEVTDDLARRLNKEVLAIEQDEFKLRELYASRLNSVLAPKKMARYLQIESKIRAAIRYELAAEIPLVP